MTTDDPWDFYPCRVDDAPASISLATRHGDEARPAVLTTLYVAGINLDDPGEHGMGTESEAEVLWAAEEEFTEKLGAHGFVHVGRLRNKGCWQVSYYGAGGLETEFHGLLGITLATTGREIWTHIAADPSWDYYDSFLAPDKERRHWMSNRSVVESLEGSGDALTTPRKVDHSARFAARDSADAFGSAAGALGFTATVSGDAEGDSLVAVEREDPVNLAHIHDVVMELVELAAAHQGEYDGWGCVEVLEETPGP